jgi:hypothetical protein
MQSGSRPSSYIRQMMMRGLRQQGLDSGCGNNEDKKRDNALHVTGVHNIAVHLLYIWNPRVRKCHNLCGTIKTHLHEFLNQIEKIAQYTHSALKTEISSAQGYYTLVLHRVIAPCRTGRRDRFHRCLAQPALRYVWLWRWFIWYHSQRYHRRP